MKIKINIFFVIFFLYIYWKKFKYKKNCEFYNLNNKPSQINISNNNTIQELDYISEFKNLDFNGNNNNKLMKRPEIIVSDLEDYYKNNQLLFQNNDSNETFNNNNQIALNKDNYKNNCRNKIYNSSNNKKFNNNNNKKIIQKKIPIIKVKMNWLIFIFFQNNII